MKKKNVNHSDRTRLEDVMWISSEMQPSHSLGDARQVAQQVIHCLQKSGGQSYASALECGLAAKFFM